MLDVNKPYSEETISVTVTKRANEANRWCRLYADWDVDHRYTDAIMLGVDVKWVPSFQRGVQSRPAVLQLSNSQHCLVLQLLYLDRFPERVMDLLECTSVLKASWGASRDYNLIDHYCSLDCRGWQDLRSMAADDVYAGWPWKCSLRTLYEVFLKEEPFPQVRYLQMSDWERFHLSRSQVKYASMDAWMSYRLLECLEPVELLCGRS